MDLLPMLAAASGAGGETDDDFASTVLLLHGDGTNGAQNNTFLDSSTNNFTITRAGNTTQGSFSPFSKPDGRWGNYFDGVGDRLDIADNAAFNLSSTAFTIEAWVYMEANNGQYANWVVGKRSTAGITSYYTSWILHVNSSNEPVFADQNESITSSTAIALNTWNHLVATHDGTNASLYLNGSLVAGPTAITILNETLDSPVTIGDYTVGTSPAFKGYISGVKIVKGYANVPSGIPTTPATATVGTSLLTCQSNRFIDNSANAFAITASGNVKVTPFSPFPITTEYSPSVNGGSGYFDGSGDYLSSAGGGSIGSGEFTIRAWVYPTALSSAYNHVFDTRPNSDATGFSWGVESDGQIFFYSENAFRIQNAGAAGVVPLNSWSHICVTRDSSDNLKAFVNGVQVGSTVSSWTSNYTQTTTLISKYWGGTDHWTGYIADAQMIAGVADSSVPTAPSTNVSGTTLLCNFTNAGIFDNTCFNNLETVADCAINTTTKKYGTGSLSFDGTGDYLFIPPTPDLHLGSGNWTIEFWMYAPDVTTYQDLIGLNFNTNQSSYASVRLVVTSGQFQVLASTTGSSWTTNTTIGSVSTNTWTHVALVRTSSTTLNLFINGVSAGTPAVSGSLYAGAHGSRIANLYWSGNFYYSGFIDDLRITKGVARYTTTFTPPDKAFPNIGA